MNNIDHTAYPAKLRRAEWASLEYILADCREALAAMPDGPKAGYYRDEINYCHMEMQRRNTVKKWSPES